MHWKQNNRGYFYWMRERTGKEISLCHVMSCHAVWVFLLIVSKGESRNILLKNSIMSDLLYNDFFIACTLLWFTLLYVSLLYFIVPGIFLYCTLFSTWTLLFNIIPTWYQIIFFFIRIFTFLSEEWSRDLSRKREGKRKRKREWWNILQLA